MFGSRSLRSFRGYGALGSLLAIGGGIASYKHIAHAENQPLVVPGVFLWGDNSKGLIASGTLTSSSIRTPTRVPFLDKQKVRSLAVCPEYAVAALNNGDVVQWTSPEQGNVALKSKNIIDLLISPQTHVAVALAQNGSVYTWGLDNASNNEPKKLTLDSKLGWFEKIVSVKCGADHIAALTNKGRVYTASLQQCEDHHGQLGIAAFPHFEPMPEPGTLHSVKLLEQPVKQIACGAYHSLFLASNGELYGCGSNKHGQLMLPYTVKNTKVSVPTKLPTISPASSVESIAAGSSLSYLFPTNANAWFVAGDGEYGQFGTGSFSQCQVSPLRMTPFDSMREYDESQGRVVPLCIARDGLRVGSTHVFAAINNAARDWVVWGSNERGQLGNNKLSKLVKPVPVASTVVDYAALGATDFVVGDKISGCFEACK